MSDDYQHAMLSLSKIKMINSQSSYIVIKMNSYHSLVLKLDIIITVGSGKKCGYLCKVIVKGDHEQLFTVI